MGFSALPGKEGAFLVVFLLAVLFAVFCLCLERRLRRLARENALLKKRLNEVARRSKAPEVKGPTAPHRPAADRKEPRAAGGFAASLEQARTKSRLQGGDGAGEAPEKYRLLASLVKGGVDAGEMEEALKILKVSPTEAEQLMKLSRISRRGAENIRD